MTEYKHLEIAKEAPLCISDIVGVLGIMLLVISLAFLPNIRAAFTHSQTTDKT